MKRRLYCRLLIASVMIIFGVLDPAAFSQSSFERDLDMLTQQRDDALYKAEVEVYRKYKMQLDDLLRQAIRNDDLAAAIKVKSALSNLPASILLERKAPTTAGELAEFLDDTEWSVRYGSPQGDEVYTLTFEKDGKMTQSLGAVSRVAFRELRTIKLWGFDTATLNAEFNEFKATDATGKVYYGVLLPKN